MREEERARHFFEALDALLRGEEPQLDDEELREILDIAQLRRAAARDAAGLAEKYREFVWARIEARIRQMLEKRGQRPNGITNPQEVGETEASEGSEEPEFNDLRDIIAARHRLAEERASKAADYRDLVWRRIVARIEGRQVPKWRRLLPLRFLSQREQEEADQLCQAIDELILGQPIWEAAESSLKDLVHLARLRHAMSKALVSSAVPYQERLWTHLRPRLMAQARRGDRPSPKALTIGRLAAVGPKLAAVAALVALVIFAVGPLPATGLADHPISQFVRFVRQLIGVTEIDGPPDFFPATDTLEGTNVTIAQARELMGLPLREPGSLPPGFQAVASRYFPQAITADQGGLFELAYELVGAGANPPTLVIWQEQASPNTVAVQSGFAQPLALANGVQGTYFEGMWWVEDTQILWGAEGAQTLLFDQGQVRTVILYLGGDKLDIQALLAIANSMLGAEAS